MFVLRMDRLSNIRDFIIFWKDYYNYGKYTEEDYESHLRKGSLLEAEDIGFLLEWKNGKPLSQKKNSILRKCIENIDKLNEFRKLDNTTKTDFENFYNFIYNEITRGPVWKIFIIHITRPDEYPMFDQHVVRAFNYIEGGVIVEKSLRDKESYFGYLDFLIKIKKSAKMDFRTIDKALFAFGKFLKEYKSQVNKIEF